MKIDFDDLADRYTDSQVFKSESQSTKTIRWAGYYDCLVEIVAPLQKALENIEDHHGENTEWRDIARNILLELKYDDFWRDRK